MGTFRNIIDELKSIGTPIKKFGDMHVKFTTELINYSYEEIHKVPKELFKKKILIDFEILNDFARTNLKGNETFHLYIGGPNDIRTVTIEESLIIAKGLMSLLNGERLLSKSAIVRLFSRNAQRIEFVQKLAGLFTIDYLNKPQISFSPDYSKFQIKIPARTISSKENYVRIAKSYFLEERYSQKPHEAGVQGENNDIYINFTYPPEGADHVDYYYIDVLWKVEF